MPRPAAMGSDAAAASARDGMLGGSASETVCECSGCGGCGTDAAAAVAAAVRTAVCECVGCGGENCECVGCGGDRALVGAGDK